MIVEDDRKLNDGIVLALRENCNAFLQCRTLAEARNLLTQEEIALVLLDVNLPDGNGIDFVREVRAYSPVPILLITVNNMELDIVTGLEAGANDYITKPFSLMVLRARVAVWLRAGSVQPDRFSMGPFDFDFRKMEFRREGRLVELSRTEQRLLRVLCENQGVTVKRSALIDSVWQGDGEYVDEHALTVTIKRLRDKLEKDCANPDYIRTVYGIGYTWAVDL
ncbi:MAG: response regulator transcription factor [Lachnospiraceae bacterium]